MSKTTITILQRGIQSGLRLLLIVLSICGAALPAAANGVPNLFLPGGVPVYAFEFGSDGTGDGEFGFLDGVAVGSDGTIYVADSGSHEIDIFDSEGTFIESFGTQGAGDGQFEYPRDVAVDSQGNIYVADTENFRIQKFTSAGVFITKWGANGAGNGEFNFPYRLALDASDNVFVADRDNHRVQKFDADGTYLTQWGSSGPGDGQFNQPRGIAIDGVGDVYVVDRSNRRVQKFSASGTFITKWGTAGSGNGQFSNGMAGIAVDSVGNIHVSDCDNDFISRVQVFDPSGGYIAQYGSYGNGAGQFNSALDLATTPSGAIVLSDQTQRNVMVFNAGASVAVTMDEDGAPTPFVAPALTAVDSTGDTSLIEWSVTTPATNGTATVSGMGRSPSVFTYVPNPNFNGLDSFTITVTDSDSLTDSIAVNLTVNAVDDAPVITQTGPLAVTMDEDGAPTTFLAPALDATHGDDATLTWSVHEQAGHGTATVSGDGASPAVFDYTPDANYNG